MTTSPRSASSSATTSGSCAIRWTARRAPATLVDAKFSLPFLVAVAAVRRT